MVGSSTESLETILQRLAAYSQGTSTSNDEPNAQQFAVIAATPSNQHPSSNSTYSIGKNAYENRSSRSEPTPQMSSLGITDHLQRLQQITNAARVNPQLNSSTFQNKALQQKPPILEWAPALRHVIVIGSQDPELEQKVRKVCRLLGSKFAWC